MKPGRVREQDKKKGAPRENPFDGIETEEVYVVTVTTVKVIFAIISLVGSVITIYQFVI